MDDRHIFSKETDSEALAMDIVSFLQKWGMWQDVQIFTGGKCYTDEKGGLVIREEEHPEVYLKGPIESDEGIIWEEFSNPERLLDMTIEGPLSTLLRHRAYEVELEDVADEVKQLIVSETGDNQEEIAELKEECLKIKEEYLKGEYSWDPAEFDSFEDWLKVNQYGAMDLFNYKYYLDVKEIEFSSKEEYEDFIMYQAAERENVINDHIECCIGDDLLDYDWDSGMFYDEGKIAGMAINEFDDLLERYGLWYDLGFCWSLTTYRI